ncbi:MAG: hypothetical protein P9X24_12825 [Candidatus Hatepunaea meridiana]|nr:hypothetical protein [Candidatus Hatepunaea meridiana]
MPTLNLRRFANPDMLKTIQLKHLIQLLKPNEDYLSGRGLSLSADRHEDFDYELLANILIDPDGQIPMDLLNALYFVHEMSHEDGMDDLIQGVQESGLVISSEDDSSPADIAVQVWLQDSNLLERKHAEQSMQKKRSFEYFLAEETSLKTTPSLDTPTIAILEKNLEEWFLANKRGRGTKVFAFDREDEVRFLVRHGRPFRREGSIVDGQSSSIFFRPENHDVLVYDKALGELRMNAENKRIKKIYLEFFGKYLFGNKNHFPGANKYTLEPLRIDGRSSLVCSDIPGLEWIRLKEVQYSWDSEIPETEIHKATDLFQCMADREEEIPEEVGLIGASFDVKFENIRSPRTLTICRGNIAQYSHDDDCVCLEKWMTKRGFILPAGVNDAEAKDEDVVGS